MKLLIPAILCPLLAAGAFAQHSGGRATGHIAAAIGGNGHIVSSGGGRIGGVAGRYGHSGYRGYGSFYGRNSYRPGYYGYPGLWDFGLSGGPYYDSGYSDQGYYGGAYQSSPNVTVVYPPPQEPVTPTVIALPVHAVIHEYRQPEDYGLPGEHRGTPAQVSGPVVYLIAFNDHAIRAASTYWVDNGKLHYLDLDHKERQAPLSEVDQDLSARLNRERNVPFRLP